MNAVPSPISLAALALLPQVGSAPAEQLRDGLRKAPRNVGEVLATWVDAFFAHLPGAITGLLLLLIFVLLSRFAVRLVRRVSERAGTDASLRDLLLPLVRFSVLAVGVLMALDQMGFQVSSLLAGLGIAGLAAGLAAQETLANLVAGFVLLWDRPFRVGDLVTIDGFQGQVAELGLRSTRIRTYEGREVVLPNKDVAQHPVINHSRYPAVRHNAAFSIGYGVPVERAREILLRAARQQAEVLADPEPMVVVTALRDSAVELELRVWVNDLLSPRSSLFHLLEVGKAALEEAGVEIPLPQRVVRLRDAAPPRESSSAR